MMQPHVLACKSFIMGTCNLLIVGLPDGWRVQMGPFPPEVDHWQDFGGVTWAQVGRSSYQAVGSGASALLRVDIGRWHGANGAHGGAGQRIGIGRRSGGGRRIGAGAAAGRFDNRFDPRRALHRVHDAGESALGGHPGAWALGEVRRGFGRWGKPVPALALTAACPSTGRVIRLLAEGPSRPVLEDVLEANLACWTCH
ncbi:MAG: hypothetical protein FWJ62_06510 [Thermaerobacter sp.]